MGKHVIRNGKLDYLGNYRLFQEHKLYNFPRNVHDFGSMHLHLRLVIYNIILFLHVLMLYIDKPFKWYVLSIASRPDQMLEDSIFGTLSESRSVSPPKLKLILRAGKYNYLLFEFVRVLHYVIGISLFLRNIQRFLHTGSADVWYFRTRVNLFSQRERGNAISEWVL